MQQITSGQMAALEKTMADRLVERLAVFVRRTCDTADALDRTLVPADDPTLKDGIRTLLARAGTYGLSSERALTTFVALGYSYARDFDQIPGARRMLQDRSDPPDQRIVNVLDAVVHAEILQRRRSGF